MPLDFVELADGTKVSTTTGEVIREEKPRASASLPNTSVAPSESNSFVTTRLSDLPLEPKKMNGVAALIVYRLLGMPDHDIAEALGTDVEKVKAISNAQVFSDLFTKVTNEVMDRNSENMRIRLASLAQDALNKVYDIMSDGDDKNALKAAQDILDRAGHRPADVIMHKHEVNGGLKIEFIARKAEKDLPSITIDH